jgi:hypothetical protein
MDPTRLLIAIAIGAVIGIVIVLALSLSLRWLGARRGETTERRALRLPWLAQAAIVVIAMIGYGYVGYFNRSAAPPPEPAPTAASDTPTTAQIAVGGVTLSFMPPAGYCIYPAPLLDTVIAHQAQINPDNVVHTVFGSCDQLHEAGLAQTRIRDFGMLMTPKAQLSQNFDGPALDRAVASAIDPSSVKETLDQRLRQAQSRLKLQSFSALGLLDRDQSAAYFGYLFKADTEDESFAQACIMAMTTVKGRLVSYYLYSDYSKDARAALLALLQKAKAGIGDFTARNG